MSRATTGSGTSFRGAGGVSGQGDLGVSPSGTGERVWAPGAAGMWVSRGRCPYPRNPHPGLVRGALPPRASRRCRARRPLPGAQAKSTSDNLI